MPGSIQKGLFIAAGSLCLALGAIGIFLPLLPTTPFLLLAAACFFRGSDRMYAWLINHPWFGSHIARYRRYRAVSRRAKIVSIVTLWLFIGFAALFVTQALWLRLALATIAVAVTLYLLSLKTATEEMSRSSR